MAIMRFSSPAAIGRHKKPFTGCLHWGSVRHHKTTNTVVMHHRCRPPLQAERRSCVLWNFFAVKVELWPVATSTAEKETPWHTLASKHLLPSVYGVGVQAWQSKVLKHKVLALLLEALGGLKHRAQLLDVLGSEPHLSS